MRRARIGGVGPLAQVALIKEHGVVVVAEVEVALADVEDELGCRVQVVGRGEADECGGEVTLGVVVVGGREACFRGGTVARCAGEQQDSQQADDHL